MTAIEHNPQIEGLDSFEKAFMKVITFAHPMSKFTSLNYYDHLNVLFTDSSLNRYIAYRRNRRHGSPTFHTCATTCFQITIFFEFFYYNPIYLYVFGCMDHRHRSPWRTDGDILLVTWIFDIH